MKMAKMNEGTKKVTRIAISYNPFPVFKFEWVSDNASKYHKKIGMQKYFDQRDDTTNTLSSVERSFEVTSIVEQLVVKYPELQRVPADTLESMVEKLFYKQARTRPPTADDSQHMKVNMAIERGSLTLSPLKVAKDPLSVSHDLDLRLYRNSFSSAQGPVNGRVSEGDAEPSSSVPAEIHTKTEVASVDKERLKQYGDLNRTSEEELASAKSEMDTLFEHSKILPGHDGYEYDIRVDFEPDEESSWD